MNAEINYLHSKIAAISYRLDALSLGCDCQNQLNVPGYAIGQVITSTAPVGPGTVINHSVFFPCDGGIYQYVDRNNIQHAVSTNDYSGALVRAVNASTPNWVGLKGVLGGIDPHTHAVGTDEITG